MASHKVFILGVCIILSLTGGCANAFHPSNSIRGAYWPSWVSSTLPPSAIDTSLFTHIYYAFLSPNNVTFQFEVSSSTATVLLNLTSTLRGKNPPVKTLFSIGGGGEGSSLFARMASSSSSRKNFISSTIDVARKYGFNGVDLDWEFPENSQDMENLGNLLHEWRIEVENEAKLTHKAPLLLTAAVYFSANFFLSDNRRSYPVGSISKNLDWIHAMCYDYHGSWDTSATGAQAALFDPKSNISTSYGLKSWLEAGLPREKLVMGLPLYGRTWNLKDPRSYGVGAPAVDVGPGEGVLIFSEVEKFNKDNNASVFYDFVTVSAYSVAGTSWVGYDDTKSTSVKVIYARTVGLRGYFFWALGYDSGWKISRRASQLWK